MSLHSFSCACRGLALTFVCATAAQAQILQNQPELCGKPGVAVALPEGTSFTYTDGLSASLTLKLKNGTSKTVDLVLASSVPQVCPLEGSRLLVFGTVVGQDGPHVWIISQIDGAVLDHIGSRDPVLSPDQHWLIYRQFYPPHVEVVAEFYLLYNLAKDATGNSPPEIDRRFPRPSGRQVYPVTSDHFPHRHDEVLEPTHEFESESFYWSPDSRFVVFADTTATGSKTIILVKVEESDITTYTHPLQEGEICANRTDLRGVLRGAILHGVEFIPTQAPLPDVWATFSGIRCDDPLRLRAQDFKQAAVEVHKKISPPKK